MSRVHALVRRAPNGAVTIRDLGSRTGVLVNGVPIDQEVQLEDGSVLFVGAHVFVCRSMSPEHLEAVTMERASPFGPVPTLSPHLARLCMRLRRLAASDVDLLLGGETGVGKEIFAQSIHRASKRRGPLVAINCAALPDTLLESELFGYARGAHSMAEHGKQGLIEQAEGGTLFLDEIGEMSGTAQSKLLRFLQDRLVLPLGSTTHRRLNVRVIAATRRAVALCDDASGVRFDLAARLGPEPLMLPPLRTRPEDIGLLTRFFLRDSPRPFDIRAYRALFTHKWPGNVRELEKTLQMAAVLSEEQRQIHPEHLGFGYGPDSTLSDGLLNPADLPDAFGSIGAAEAQAARPTPEALATLLTRHQGNVAEVARELHRQRTLVWRWLRQAGIDPARYRPTA